MQSAGDDKVTVSRIGFWTAIISAVGAVLALIGTLVGLIPTPSSTTGEPSPTETVTAYRTVTPSAEPGGPTSATTSEGTGKFKAVFKDQRLKMEPGDRASVVDLDKNKVAVVSEAEWEDGTAVQLGYDIELEWRGFMASAGPWKWSTKAAAPTTPGACLEAARTSEDDPFGYSVSPGTGTDSGDSFCLETSEGNVAQVRFLSYVEGDASIASFVYTLWALA